MLPGEILPWLSPFPPLLKPVEQSPVPLKKDDAKRRRKTSAGQSKRDRGHLMPTGHLWSAGDKDRTEGQETAALLVPIPSWSQLPSTDGTQERPWTPTSQSSYGTAQHSGKGVPREDPKELTSSPAPTSVQHSSPQTWHSAALGWLLLICCQAA